MSSFDDKIWEWANYIERKGRTAEAEALVTAYLKGEITAIEWCQRMADLLDFPESEG